MSKEKYENDLFEKFEKDYISKEANKMASDYQFVKGFVAKIMLIYDDMLKKFLNKNAKSIDTFFDHTNKSINNKNDYFLMRLKFLYAIPNLLVNYENEIDIDYVFLTEKFYEVNDEKEANKIKKTLDELQKKIDLDKNSVFDLQGLYKCGNFILTFINYFDFRKEIAVKLLKASLEIRSGIFENTIDQHFIQSKGNESNWSGASL